MTVLDSGPDSGPIPEGVPFMHQDADTMIYNFKVHPCQRKGAHSWTECPYTHSGEKAARRCPKSYIYSAEACPDARKSGKCSRGDNCPYSHGVFEQWLHPSRFRTQLCSFGTACRRPVCFFAHTVQELRGPTTCGPIPSPVCGPSPLPGLAPAAGQIGLDAAALAAAAASGGKDTGYTAALVQQALLAQMGQAAAMQQLDGATATMINRWQAASCAALANAAECQRQQQQHQAQAAAAAAAAIAAAHGANPATLLHMAQAAQAYQAAAAAAAAAAAKIPMPNAAALAGLASPNSVANSMHSSNPQMLCVGGSSSQSNSSTASSPTCSSQHNSSLASVSTFMDNNSMNGQQRCGQELPLSSQAAAAAAGLYDSYLLQQALAGAGSGWSAPSSSAAAASQLAGAACQLPPVSGAASLSPSSAGSYSPWLPSTSAAAVGLGLGGGYPSGLMPATPGIADAGMPAAANLAASCSFDALASHLSRQLSLQAYQA